MSASNEPLIDPKELFPAVVGFGLGIGILAFFLLLAIGLDMTLLVNHADIPMQ